MADAKKLSVEVQTTATGDGLQKTAAGIEKVSKAAAAAEKPLKNNARETESLVEAVDKLGSRNNAAKDAIEGIGQAARGGENAFFGLAKAVRGAKEALAGGIKLTGIGLAIAGFTAFLKILDQVQERLSAELEALKNVKNSGERLGETYEALGKSAKSSADKQVAEIKRVSDSFKELDELAAEAKDRINEVNDANKRRELAQLEKSTAEKLQKASTPEARDKITSDASRQRQAIEDRAQRTQLDNQRLQANLEISQSESRIGELRQKREPAAANLQFAERQAQDARATLESFRSGGGDINSKFGEELRDKVRVADKTVEELGKVLESVDKEIGPEVRNLETRIRKARTTLDVNKLDRQTQSAEEATRKVGAVDTVQSRIKELGLKAESAAAQGDFASQDEAVAERKKLLAQAARERVQAPPGNQTGPSAPKDARPGTINGQALKPVGNQNSIERAGEKAERAADKIEQAEPIKAEKLGDSLEQIQQDFVGKLSESQKSIDQAASVVGSMKEQLPPPLDLSPFTASFESFAATNLQRHSESQTSIQQLSIRISQLEQQLLSRRQ
jgi:chromosome segregation ATPase